MSTVDIGEVRRRMAEYAALTALDQDPPPTDLRIIMGAERLLVYVPLLLAEIEQLRRRAAEVSRG